MLGLVAVHWTALQHWDASFDDRVNRAVAAHPVEVDSWKAITTALAPLTWEVLAVAAAVWLWWRVRDRRAAVFVLLAIFGTLGLYDLVKALVGRRRPVVPTPLWTAQGASFPSGHAMMSAVAMSLAAVAALRLRRRLVRTLLVVGAVLVALAVAASRVALGAHYPSDVLGGWLLAGAWLCLLAGTFGPGGVLAARERASSRSARPAPPRGGGSPRAGSAG